MTTWKAAKSASPDALERKKSAIDSQGSARPGAGKVNRSHSDGTRVVFPDDEVVAFRVDREVAVRHRRLDDSRGASGGQLAPQLGPDALPELGVALMAGLVGSVAPLGPEEGRLIDIGRNVVERNASLDARADERRDEQGVVGGNRRGLGRGGSGSDGLASPSASRLLCAAREAGLPSRALQGAAEIRILRAAALQLHDSVHGVQTLEGVLAVEEPTRVFGPQVPLDVGRAPGAAPPRMTGIVGRAR